LPEITFEVPINTAESDIHHNDVILFVEHRQHQMRVFVPTNWARIRYREKSSLLFHAKESWRVVSIVQQLIVCDPLFGTVNLIFPKDSYPGRLVSSVNVNGL
jgi:hypothetical protein